MAKRSTAQATEEELPSLHPKLSDQLVAHEQAEKQLLAMMQSGRLPHAILLTGPRGIGKATLAYRLARTLLAPPSQDVSLFGDAAPVESLFMTNNHTTFRRIALGSHPDMMVLEAQDIKIDDARKVGEFLSMTPAESAWRVVIIDSADALNRNAANALLKTLEEPPGQAVLLLISHSPGQLLPTIRSRCRTLRLQPLTQQSFVSIMRASAPNLMPHEDAIWGELSGYSPGVALELMEGKAIVLYQELLQLIAAPDTQKQHSFADKFARKENAKEWHVLCKLLLWLLTRITTNSASVEIFSGEQEQIARMRSVKSTEEWCDLYEKTGKLLSDTDHLYLDKKQVILSLLRAIGG